MSAGVFNPVLLDLLNVPLARAGLIQHRNYHNLRRARGWAARISGE